MQYFVQLCYPIRDFLLLIVVLAYVHGVPCGYSNLFESVLESTKVGTVLFEFNVNQGDTLSISPVRKIDEGYLSLIVDQGQARIQLKHLLDAEKLDSIRRFVNSVEYKLSCLYDRTFNGQTTSKKIDYTINIVIENENDVYPTFLGAPFYKEVNELTPITTTVFILKGRAVDGDAGGYVTDFDIVDGGDEKFKLIGPTSNGMVAVAGLLDYDHGKRLYELNVSVTDNLLIQKKLTSYAILTINITDGDDQNPKFSSDSYSLSLPEQNSEILNKPLQTNPVLKAYDEDRGIDAKINYEMYKGALAEDEKYFKVDHETGEIYLITKLDREKLLRNPFIIQVKAYQVDQPVARTTLADVLVTVIDVNDNAPRMTQSVYEAEIPENSIKGTTVMQVKASDADQGENAVFGFKLSDPSSTFTINSTTGILTVLDATKLDREINSEVKCTVSAAELNTAEKLQSAPSRLIIQLTDMNDNNPIFFPTNRYQFDIEKTVAAKSPIGKVYANDSDSGVNGQVAYSIEYATSGGLNKFEIAAPGLITNVGSLSVPYVSSYTLTVQASDLALDIKERRRSTAIVTINILDVNYNPPVIQDTPYNTKIGELTPPNSIVFQIKASDPDPTSTLSYSIISGDPYSQFTISQSGVISTVKDLDREKISAYDLTVQVSDGIFNTNTVANIKLIDANDNPPNFIKDKYDFKISEEEPGGIVVGYVNATDIDAGGNSKVTYLLAEKSTEEFFEVDANNGKITTAKKLDREIQATYSFSIVAEDAGLPPRRSSCRVKVVILDINDHIPRFAEKVYTISIPENETAKNFFTPQIIDEDAGENADVTFSLDTGDVKLFEIDKNSGSLSSKSPLQANKNKTMYMVVISVRNTEPIVGLSAKTPKNDATVFIKLVVKIPVINRTKGLEFIKQNYSVMIKENLRPPQLVIDLNSTSELNDKPVTYTIISGSEGGLFSMTENTGKIICNRPLDRETKDQFIIIVKVESINATIREKNNAEQTEATVTVNVGDTNDNPPVFNDIVVGVPAQTSYNDIVVKLKATDRDLGENAVIKYTLNDGNNKDNFYIDENPGSDDVRSKLDFSFETKSVFIFSATATDQNGEGLSATAKVTVYKLTVSQTAILVANVGKEDLERDLDVIIGNLSNILGFTVRSMKVEPHVEKAEQKIDPTKSDLYFYAINPSDGRIVGKDFLLEAIKLKNKEIDELFKRYKIEAVKAIPVVNRVIPLGPEIGLLMLASLIIIGNILGMVVVSISWQRREVVSKKMNGFSTLTLKDMVSKDDIGFSLANPLYLDHSIVEKETGEPVSS